MSTIGRGGGRFLPIINYPRNARIFFIVCASLSVERENKQTIRESTNDKTSKNAANCNLGVAVEVSHLGATVNAEVVVDQVERAPVIVAAVEATTRHHHHRRNHQ
jgi:hypothetical protein